MKTIDEIINTSTDPREIKRALSVKMLFAGIAPRLIANLLGVSEQFVSKWKKRYQQEGASGLYVAYQGKQPYLDADQKQAVIEWIQEHKTITVETLRDHIEEKYKIVYRSKQSYYALLSASGMSYHRTMAANPKRDEEQILHKREEIKNKVAEHQSEIEQGKIVVLFEDECHLLWGDVCGLAWGKRNAPLEVPMTNQKLRQTYYGAVNFLTQQFHLKPFSSGNGENTVAYVKWLRTLYPDAKLWLLWDGATYYRYSEIRAYLLEINADLPEEEWLVTCVLFAPNAPEQNPVEDIWLKGKNWLRKNFAFNKTFSDVKKCFSEYLQESVFPSAKYGWYTPSPQII